MLKPTAQRVKCKEANKHAPDKDVELTLELEMDDEVKAIIASPEKHADAMLDVTVLKPRSDDLYTAQKRIMTGEEVKKFIEAMTATERKTSASTARPAKDISTGKPNHKSPMDKFAPPTVEPRTSPACKRNLNKPVLGSLTEMDKDKIKQVYTASRTFTELNSMFECLNKYQRDANLKPEEPCTCKNCSILGVLADAQKRPFAAETTRSSTRKLSKEEFNATKKKLADGNWNHSHCQYYFKHLQDRIKSLEARVAAQEERSVAKDYFKRIITKIMTHINKVTSYASQIRMEIPHHNVAKPANNHPKGVSDKYTQKYVVNHAEAPSLGGLWKWGEDFLKPGVDMKNKLISLMEDTLSSLKKSKEKPKEEEIERFVQRFSADLYKTIGRADGSDKREKLVEMEERVNVTYVNSKVLKWKETETTFKLESDKESSMKTVNDHRKVQEIYKVEFMKTLKSTREEDKRKLWSSIWKQAVNNRQDRKDKVTIQIPDRKDPKRRRVEIAYTLGDLEYLLLGQKHTDSRVR